MVPMVVAVLAPGMVVVVVVRCHGGIMPWLS
jgi:hypothetical protein